MTSGANASATAVVARYQRTDGAIESKRASLRDGHRSGSRASDGARRIGGQPVAMLPQAWPEDGVKGTSGGPADHRLPDGIVAVWWSDQAAAERLGDGV